MLGFVAMTCWGQGLPIHIAAAQETKTPENQTPGDLEAEYDRAFKTMFADPADLDKAFAFAKLAIRIADFEGAISTLERMLIIDGNLPRVRMELGVLYFRLKSLEVAKGYFEDVLADKSAPPIVIERVKVLLAKVEAETSVHTFQSTLFFGIRHQSNANAGPSGTRVKVLGLDVDLDTTFTNKPDVDTFETIRIKYSYDFGVEPRVDLENELVLYNANQATQDQVDTSVAQVKSGPRFVVDPDIARGLDVRPYVRWDSVVLADRLYYVAYGGGVDANYVVGPGTRLSFDGNYVERTHNNTASSPTLTDLNGPRGAVSVSMTHALTPALRANLSANAGREAPQDSGSRNWSFGTSATLTRVFDSPFPTWTGPWSVAGTAQVSTSIYDDPNATIDPSVTREDESYSGQLVGTVPLSDRISLVTTGVYKKVRSNLPNFTYDNWSFTLGLAVQF